MGYMGVSLLRLPDWKDDATLWRKTCEDEPRSARAHTWTGLDLKHQNRLPEALEHFTLAAMLNPQDSTPLVNRAIIYGQLGDLQEAEKTLRKAVALRPDRLSARWNLSVALQIQGRYEEALKEIEKVLVLDPSYRQALRAKIVLLVAKEAYVPARKAAQELLLIDPTDQEAREAIAFLAKKISEAVPD